MSNVIKRNLNESTVEFQVIIRGARRQSKYTMRARVAAMDVDDPAPAITIYLPGED